MSGSSFLLDTNVILYLLSGNKTIADILPDSHLYVSFISQLELLGYKEITLKEQGLVKQFLQEVIIVDITEDIKNVTIDLKQRYSIKLPDAIIAATAIYLDIPLLTADKGFSKIEALNLALYEE